jgi:hypothetical protein
MAVISISIEESEEQIVSGIPRSITITTNIAATIFYTLDGSVPTLFSDIYIGTLFLPKDKISIVLNVFATDGVDSSPIITESYETNIINNIRLPHSTTDAPLGTNYSGLFPFGSNVSQPDAHFLNPANAGITVNDPELPATSTGFDGNGNPNAFTNLPYNSENYNVIYVSPKDPGNPGIGTLPGNVTIQQEIPPEESTRQFTSTFDPRAFVIFQDFSLENPGDPIQINKANFSIDSEPENNPSQFYNTGLDSPPLTGSFVSRHYNPRDNTMTYYYRDSASNKWIISKQPYIATSGYDGNLSGSIKFDRKPGSRYVYEWIPFRQRYLF